MAEPAVKLTHPPGFKPGNAPEFSVAELASAIKRSLEDGFGHVRLRGEISGYRGPHASGHCYFALKDDQAKIDAVIWKGVFGRIKFRPEEGMEVIAHGRVTSYPGSSKYQIVIEAMEPAGVGALMALLEDRKRRFAAEGLFDDERKQPLPFMPRVVGIITSPTGAVIRDMLAGFTERFPARVIVWPCRVQGETCGAEVSAAITGFNALVPNGAIPRPDVLIVARGGGSLEDLWGFNDEIVVRACADSTIPIVSAVGHETDWTLLDLVADARAPTPTKAAEWVVPKYSELLAEMGDLTARLAVGMRRSLETARAHLKSAARGLPRIEDLVRNPRQRFDSVEQRLGRGLLANIRAHHTQLTRVTARLHPRLLTVRIARLTDAVTSLGTRKSASLARLAASRRVRFEGASSRLRPAPISQRITRANDALALLQARWARALSHTLARSRQQLDARAQMLAALSYQGVLARGFALVRDGNGLMVRSAGQVTAGSALGIEFGDGTVRVQATEQGQRNPDAPPTKSVRNRAQTKVTRDDGDMTETAGEGTQSPAAAAKPANTLRTSKPRTSSGPRGSGSGGAGSGGQGTLF